MKLTIRITVVENGARIQAPVVLRRKRIRAPRILAFEIRAPTDPANVHEIGDLARLHHLCDIWRLRSHVAVRELGELEELGGSGDMGGLDVGEASLVLLADDGVDGRFGCFRGGGVAGFGWRGGGGCSCSV